MWELVKKKEELRIEEKKTKRWNDAFFKPFFQTFSFSAWDQFCWKYTLKRERRRRRTLLSLSVSQGPGLKRAESHVCSSGIPRFPIAAKPGEVLLEIKWAADAACFCTRQTHEPRRLPSLGSYRRVSQRPYQHHQSLKCFFLPSSFLTPIL